MEMIAVAWGFSILYIWKDSIKEYLSDVIALGIKKSKEIKDDKK